MNECCCNEKSCSSSGVSVVSTVLSLKDILGAWKVRWGIGRDNYKVTPGLYAVGNPDDRSPVLVSANYKLTFDILRKNLSCLDCWILILDTKGVNVWCAAGKGTFGTNELVNRIESTRLKNIVNHRKIVIPQLGAVGISAHEVARLTGFSVTYGPVRASDIKKFIASDYTATKEMRTVKFTMLDRFVLTPIEFVVAVKISIFVFGVLFLLNLVATRPFGIEDFFVYSAAVIAGTVFTPIFLPFIPGRAFAFKGWLLGAITTSVIVWNFGWFESPYLLLGIRVYAYTTIEFGFCRYEFYRGKYIYVIFRRG